MGVRTSASGGAEDGTKVLGAAIRFLPRAAVEDLHDVDRIRQYLDGSLAQMASKRVVGMLQIYKATLRLDLTGGVARRETTLHRSLQEEADQLAVGGHDLLTNHDSIPASSTYPSRSVYGVVIGEKNRSQSEETTSRCHAFGITLAVKRRQAMDMEVDTDQDGSEVNANSRWDPEALRRDDATALQCTQRGRRQDDLGLLTCWRTNSGPMPSWRSLACYSQISLGTSDFDLDPDQAGQPLNEFGRPPR